MKWRPIPSYEDRLEVSDTGLVRSTIDNRHRKLYLSKGGYVTLSFGWAHRRPSTKIVSRLVAEVFLPNPDNLAEVNHIDGNKENNQVNNLEWCTSKENKAHAIKMGLGYIGEHNSHAVLTKEKVLKIREDADKFSRTELSKMCGIQASGISKIVLRRTWKHI